ncbi:MAG: 3-deoxy-D-manno-octulosonic acid transferase [Litorivicinaceae bacterium]
MFRHLYSVVHVLALPGLIWHVFRKYRREGHAAEIWARLIGRPPQVAPGGVWIHACSVGEAQVALTLARTLTDGASIPQIWFTSTTPSGLNRLKEQGAGRPLAVFPWDLPWVWTRWLRQTRPRACVVIETELWPNLVAACHAQRIPVILANGRLSARSMRGYQRWSWLTRPLWQQLSLTLMQGDADRVRAIALGASPATSVVMGSIKLDQDAPVADPETVARLRHWAADRPVLSVISSHPTEEAQILEALGDRRHEWAIILVPRHPSRAVALSRDIEPLSVCLSEDSLPCAAIVIVDRFGLVGSVLAVTSVAVLGGTWIPHGGQNPVEIARWRRPMIAGAHVFNFSDICAGLIEVGALIQSTLPCLASDAARVQADAQDRGEAAFAWVAQQSGATLRQAHAITELLGQQDAREPA